MYVGTIALVLGGLLALLENGFGQAPDWLTSGLRPASKDRWSINYRLQDKASSPTGEKVDEDVSVASRFPVKAEYLLDLPQGKVVITSKDGVEKVIYLIDGLTLSRDASGGRIKTAIFGPYTDADGWFGVYYPGFSWIGKKTYISVEEIDGKACYHFRYKPSSGDNLDAEGGVVFDPANPRVESEAWVEVQSKRPYLFRQANLVGQYQFEPTSGNPIVLPGEFQKALRVYYGYSD